MVTKDDVKYIAKLAHLELSDQAQEEFTGQLNQILEYVNQLSELDSVLEQEKIKPTMHAWENETTTMREDVVTPSANPDKILSECAHVKDNAFAVPKVIE